ncbi:hypothetical protein [Qiania dongpingensis]|uniref:Uncharacterized protein n=1 Tax=Qiania dongpingensis TaxID=2763669 RepID=A0A7G9G6N2_9FIRM|nr:hypothetical protein [Qiania dongpingensis]QNM06464.1 hypothetical protein H9Q78_04850 [Qiania dongpingensis]
MTEKEKDLAEILAKLERDRPEIDRILNRPAIIDTDRKPKELRRIPADADFTTRDGNTEYEVAGHFCSHTDEFLLNTIIRKLGYDYEQD